MEKMIKDLLQATQMVVGLHHDLYVSYMKMTDNNEELSLRLAKDALEVLMGIGQKGNENDLLG